MGLAIGLGQLGQMFGVRCAECKDLKVIEGPVTRAGAVHMMENHGWDDGRRGWVCPGCRTTTIPKRQ